MTKTFVEEFVSKPEHMRLFQQERAIYEVTELLESLMKELRVSRSALAKRLGKSKGWVTQLLDGEANKTIRTVADAFAVLGNEYCSFYRPIQISVKVSPCAQPGSTARYDYEANRNVILSMNSACAFSSLGDDVSEANNG